MAARILMPENSGPIIWDGKETHVTVGLKCRLSKRIRSVHPRGVFFLFALDGNAMREAGTLEQVVKSPDWYLWSRCEVQQLPDGCDWYDWSLLVEFASLCYGGKGNVEALLQVVVVSDKGALIASFPKAILKMAEWETGLLAHSEQCSSYFNGLEAKLREVPCDEETQAIVEHLPKIMSRARASVRDATTEAGVSLALCYFIGAAFPEPPQIDDAEPVLRSVSGFPILPPLDFFMPTCENEYPTTSELRRLIRITAHSLLSALRQQAHELDLKYLRRNVFTTRVGSVTLDAEDPGKLNISETHPFKPGDEFALAIGDDLLFNRVLKLGSIHALGPITPFEESAKLLQLHFGPILPAENASDGKTLAFIENVEDPSPPIRDDELDELWREVFKHELNKTDPKARGEQIITGYTKQSTLYSKMNCAMYTDDAAQLRKYAPYIRELRDLFQMHHSNPDHPDQVLKPYVRDQNESPGSFDVTRRMRLTGGMTKPAFYDAYIDKFEKGKEVCFSAFTSTSEARNGGNESFGNVVFKIHLAGPQQKHSNTYFPASVRKYSAFAAENEVVLPPHSKFRVINRNIENIDEIHLALADQPCVWQTIVQQDWRAFKEWATAHPDLLDTKHSQYSIINAVARAMKTSVRLTEANPLSHCIRLKANVNEQCKQTGKTPLWQLAKNHQELKRQIKTGLDDQIKSLIWCGANPYFVVPDGESMGDWFVGIDVNAVIDVHCVWKYCVDDGIDGKVVGWHDYETDASATIDGIYKEWLQAGSGETCRKITGIKSGCFSYHLDFANMRQTQVQSGKERVIRRCCADPAEFMCLHGTCERGFAWQKVPKGWRCLGGSHFQFDEEVASRMLHQ
mmetsp:Transcript_125498/g.401349  ORF Transcript_125498/g.401349 Transcript_125498/m.401349 type:complete len:854 (-) Transcript_125498:100-2661(-)